MEQIQGAFIQGLSERNELDFATIFNKYKKQVYTVAKKFFSNMNDVEDICQEVFVRVFKSLDQFNPEYRFSTWISAITKNLCIDKIRSQGNHYVSIEEIYPDSYMSASEDGPEKRVIDKERLVQLRLMVSELPEIYQQPIILFYFNGLTYKEIIETLHVPLTTLKARIHQARMILKQQMLKEAWMEPIL